MKLDEIKRLDKIQHLKIELKKTVVILTLVIVRALVTVPKFLEKIVKEREI